MLKNIITCLFLMMVISIPTISLGHQKTESRHLEDHKPLMNEVWKMFDMLMYRVTKENGKTVYTPHFPPKLAALDGKTVQLQGYMIPIKSGFRHNKFMLSVLPIHQCIFCGENGIPAMVEIILSGEKKHRISDRPVTIKGKTLLNRKIKDRLEIWIIDAVIVENRT